MSSNQCRRCLMFPRVSLRRWRVRSSASAHHMRSQLHDARREGSSLNVSVRSRRAQWRRWMCFRSSGETEVQHRSRLHPPPASRNAVKADPAVAVEVEQTAVWRGHPRGFHPRVPSVLFHERRADDIGARPDRTRRIRPAPSSGGVRCGRAPAHIECRMVCGDLSAWHRQRWFRAAPKAGGRIWRPLLVFVDNYPVTARERCGIGFRPATVARWPSVRPASSDVEVERRRSHRIHK